MTSFLSRATSLTSSVTSNVAGVTGRISSVIKDSSKQKILLVVDDHQTDWSKYFRGKRLHGDFEIKVEQAEFKDLSAYSSSEQGTSCGIFSHDRSKQSRNIRPDFLLIRQHTKDIHEDNRNLILALKYGGIPSINSLHSVYNMTDRPWVFSQLIGIQRKLGKENFPLLEQTYFPSHKEMINNPPKFPCVIKVGHAHGGQGKIKVQSVDDYSDIVSVAAAGNTFITVEPYIDAKCDMHIQKIGSNYKAFMRKSVSGNWKSNVGSAVLEQCTVSDRYKRWLDEVSEIFGGLDLVAIECVISQDGSEYIYEVTGSQMMLMGDTQEEDRRLIAELVWAKMNNFCGTRPMVSKQTSRSSLYGDSQPPDAKQANQASAGATNISNSFTQQSQVQQTSSGTSSKRGSISGRRGSETSIGSSNEYATQKQSTPQSSGQPTQSQPQQQQQQTNHPSNPFEATANQVGQATQQLRGLFRRASQTSNDENKEDSEDTMKNLRKTFAGIFGDM